MEDEADKKQNDVNESGETKLGGSRNEEDEDIESKKEPVEPVKRNDYSLLDELTSFLYTDEDPLPILCGYFLKIME